MITRPSSQSTLSQLSFLAVVALALTAGCSGGADESSSASRRGEQPVSDTSEATPETAASSPAIDISTCGDFGAAEAAALLGIPEEEIEPSSTVEEWGTECTFVRRGDVVYEDAVSFTLSRASSADEAAQDMAQLRGHVEIGDEVMGSGKSHLVSDLGDEALWAAANDSLYVRAGAVSIIVTLPKDEGRQIEVARALLDPGSRQ